MNESQISRYLILSILLPAIYFTFYPGKIVFITLLCCYPLLVYLLFNIKKLSGPNLEGRIIIKLFLIVNLIILLRGFIDANSQKDWGAIITSIIPATIFLPLIIYLGKSATYLYNSFRYYFFSATFFALILWIFSNDGQDVYSYARQMSPICLFILLSPYLKTRWKIVIVILALLSILSDISLRATLVNVIIAYIITISFSIKKFSETKWLIKKLRFSILIIPPIFLTLGVLGIFNIFQIGDILGEYYLNDNNGKEQDLFVDSRTSIYKDVFYEIDKRESYIWGLGGSGKTATSLSDISDADFDLVYKGGRDGTESGMLNYIQWGGAISGITYFLLFAIASFNAIYKSNNWFFKMLGIWIAYKGMFSFIEDRIVLNLNTYFLMLSIGMCFNEELKKLTDAEIKCFFNSIFSKKKNSKSLTELSIT